jgi:hypothetical protein
MRKFAFLVTVLYLGSQAFDSVLRWVLNAVHADPAIYLRDVGLLGVVAACSFLIAENKDNIIRIILIAVVAGVLSCVALCSQVGVVQLLFGIKVWLPVVVGVMLVEAGVAADLDRPRLWALVWFVFCVGVLINYFYIYPWSGLNVDVGDTSISANREWGAGGVRRLSGFARSSFDAAVIILLLFVYLINRARGFLSRAALILLSAAAIILTTAKGAVAAFFVTLVLLPFLHRTRSAGSIARLPPLAALVLLSCAGLIIPVLSTQLPIPRLRTGSIEAWLFGSFIERAEITWPRAFDLLRDDWQWITGRGLGGIGAAQALFEPSIYSPGDNFFVYLYVTAGVLGLLLYLYLALSGLKLALHLQHHRMVFLLLCCCFTYGLTMNVIESACFAMGVGAACAFGARLPSLFSAGHREVGIEPQSLSRQQVTRSIT